MQTSLIKTTFKKELITAIYFWLFWVCIFSLFFGSIKSSPKEGLIVALIILAPALLPVQIINWLFTYFFNRKKLWLFFLIAMPMGWLMGIACNKLFYLVVKDSTVSINYELLIFIFGAMYIGFWYVRVAITQRLLLKEAEHKRVLSELQLLRSQLNPHFLFNALNSIYSLILSKSDKAGEAVLSLGELMRFHIESSGRQTISLKKELEMITQFIEMEKLRLENKCSISFDLQVADDDIEIAPLIFMPFVENAFKYSISKESAKNFVNIKIKAGADELLFEISNSIAKYQINLPENSSKMGIANTRKRLELHYNNNYSLDIDNDNNRFKVYLQIKLKQS